MAQTGQDATFPRIVAMGLDALLVSFGDTLDEVANRAALAYRAALDTESWDGVAETATSLASVLVRFDPRKVSHETLRGRLRDLLETTDWSAADLPGPVRRWTIPAAFGGDAGPQLAEAAHEAGLDETAAIDALVQAEIRVLALGFAPGQPYLGTLPPSWDLPRRRDLTPKVPTGALAVAVRQLVLFSAPTPTGWHQVGRTAFRCFRPGSETPFPLRPGDRVSFEPVAQAEIDRLADGNGEGGARCTVEE